MVIVLTSLSAAMAGGAGVYSSLVGFQRLSLVPGYNFVGLSFKSVDNGRGFDIQEVFDTAPLKGGLKQAESDRLILWDVAARAYIELWLFDSGGGNAEVDGKWMDSETGQRANRSIFLGDGFWLVNTTLGEVEVVLSGEIETGDVFLHAALDGYNLIASAWPTDKAVNEMVLEGFTGGLTRAESDRLILWDPANQEYVEFWLFDSGGSNPYLDGKWIDRKTGDVADATRVVAAGSAVWVIKQTGGGLVEGRPF